MSHWCKSHPQYAARRQPASYCSRCWQLWHFRCPELKEPETSITVSTFGRAIPCEGAQFAQEYTEKLIRAFTRIR